MYDMPTEIDVQADGPLRIITLNRPDVAQLGQRLSAPRSGEDLAAAE